MSKMDSIHKDAHTVHNSMVPYVQYVLYKCMLCTYFVSMHMYTYVVDVNIAVDGILWQNEIHIHSMCS